MNTDRWKSSTTQTYNEAKDYLAKVSSHLELNITQFTANNVEVIQSIHLADEDFSFTMKSSPMWQHLKQVNIYSNNFYSDNIFSFLGGSAEFSQYMTSKLAVTNKDIYFHTGSGLGDNYTTCKTTLKMLVALEELSKDQGFNLEDIISVPGIDGGTLRNRFTDLRYSKKLLAKTGTLRDTSTLSGYLFNDTKTIKFAVFNHTVDRVSARKMQNKFIKSSIDLFTNINAIEYNKVEYNPLSEVQIIK